MPDPFMVQTVKPNFTLTNVMLNRIVEIATTIGKLSLETQELHLSKEKQIRSIQSSLAIENNSLTIEQAIEIINGKQVLALPKDIEEVENAYRAYEKAFMLDPYNYRDLLKVHQLLTAGLIQESGSFRSTEVTKYQGEQLVTLGAKAKSVPKLVKELLKWAKSSDTPALIKSCIVYFKLSMIHPFSEGNGCLGRLWQKLILSQWEPLFQYLPIETVIYQHRQRYHEVLNLSHHQNDASAFIEFMLDVILSSLHAYSLTRMSDRMNEILGTKEQVIYQIIHRYLQQHPFITNKAAVALLNVSSASVRRYFATFVENGLLVSEGELRNRIYYIKN